MGFENGKLVRVTLRASKAQQQIVNTFHYDLIDDSGTGANDPQSLADTFRDDVRPGWAAFFRSAWTIDPVVVVEEKDPLNPTAPRSSWSSGTAEAGTSVGTGDLLPPGSCFVAKLTTDHIGRRFRGRMFIGGDWTAAFQTDGVWPSTSIDVPDAWLDTVPRQPDISPPLSVSTAKWCVYSRTQRAANLDPYASAINAAIVDQYVHFLRKRSLYD